MLISADRAAGEHGRPSPLLRAGGRFWSATPKQTCPRPRPRAQLAFKDSMIHGILQFTLSIAFRYILHRGESRDIRCRESCFYLVHVFFLATQAHKGAWATLQCFGILGAGRTDVGCLTRTFRQCKGALEGCVSPPRCIAQRGCRLERTLQPEDGSCTTSDRSRVHSSAAGNAPSDVLFPWET